jgi:chaperonin GroES
MKRKDMLAAGARSATFAGGIGENDVLRNVAPEGSRDETVPVIEPAKIVRKKFRPTTGVLLVRRDEVLSTSILITENMEKEKPAEGTVLEVGPGDHGIAVGDHIVFGKYAGTEFRLNGEILLLMDATDIKGTIVDESPVETLHNLAGVCIPGIARA